MTKDNKFLVVKTLNNHSSKIDIYNIYIIDNLLLSFAYEQKKGDKNEIIIYNLNNNYKILYKECKSSMVPWNQSCCQFTKNILVISGNRCEIRLFDIKTFVVIAEIIDIDFFYSIICQNQRILCGSDTGKIYEFEYNPENNTLTIINEIKIHESSIFSITRLSSGTIVTTSRDGTIKFFE